MTSYTISFGDGVIPVYPQFHIEDWLNFAGTTMSDVIAILRERPVIRVEYFFALNLVCLKIVCQDGSSYKRYVYKFEWKEWVERHLKKPKPLPEFVDEFSWKEEGF